MVLEFSFVEYYIEISALDSIKSIETKQSIEVLEDLDALHTVNEF